MPYSGPNDRDLPKAVKKLPRKLRRLWVEVFNATLKRHPDDEGRAFAAAWSAVKAARKKKAIQQLPGWLKSVWAYGYVRGREQYQDTGLALRAGWRVVRGVAEERLKMEGVQEKAAMKTEGGVKYPASAYLHVPDPEKPSTWSLRVRDENGNIDRQQLGQVAAALGPKGSRGNRAKVTEEERRKYARKVITLYREINVPDEDIPEYLWEIAGMKAPKKKSINLRATLADIESALPQAFPGLDIWVTEVFDDHVIVSLYEPGTDLGSSARKYYKVPYEVTFKPVEGDPNGAEIIDQITFAPREQWVQVVPTFTALKMFEQEDGKTRWLTVSSGMFEDREGEVVSKDFLESAVEVADRIGDRGPLMIYHIPGTRIGSCDYQAVVSGFLLESGLFDDTEVARKAVEHLKAHPDDYGVSIQFFYTRKSADGTYRPPGVILERSVLPREAAAFPWSMISVKELDGMAKAKLSERKMKALREMLGEEKANEILEQLENGAEVLKEAGVRWKEIIETEGETDEGTDSSDEDRGSDGQAETEAKETESGGEEVFEFVLSDEALDGIAQKLDDRIHDRIGQQLAPALEGLSELRAALKAITADVAELRKAEDERLAEKARDLPRATVRRIVRPTRDNPPLAGKETDEDEEKLNLADLAERALGFKEEP
ncbi:MAG: hypothetical protein J7M34_05070 [Anaerolineae bacterium]|nr:hypothetical protein [Anaerolineae bacterium]